MIELKYFFKLGLKILLLAFPIVIINVIYLNSSSWKNKDGFSYIDFTKFEYERADSIHPTSLGCTQIANQMLELLVD